MNTLADKVKRIKNWRFVFNPQQKHSIFYPVLNDAGKAAREAGYEYMAWNDRIYEWISQNPPAWVDTGFIVEDGEIVES